MLGTGWVSGTGANGLTGAHLLQSQVGLGQVDRKGREARRALMGVSPQREVGMEVSFYSHSSPSSLFETGSLILLTILIKNAGIADAT